MQKFAKIVNEETKQVDVLLNATTLPKKYEDKGFVLMEVEQSYIGEWYVKGFAPQKTTEQEMQERIIELEKSITERNIRSAFLGDEYAINKIKQVEAEIAELRRKLEEISK